MWKAWGCFIVNSLIFLPFFMFVFKLIENSLIWRLWYPTEYSKSLVFCFVHYYLCLVFSALLFWPSTSVEKYSFSYMCQSELVCLHRLTNQGSFENLCWLSAMLCLKMLSLQFVAEAPLSNSHLLRKEEVLTPCYFEWAYQWFVLLCLSLIGAMG